MEKHYFTFGMGHKKAGNCQPILAKTVAEAREKMKEMYGSEWAFHYTEEEFKRYREEGTLNERLLPETIATKETKKSILTAINRKRV